MYKSSVHFRFNIYLQVEQVFFLKVCIGTFLLCSLGEFLHHKINLSLIQQFWVENSVGDEHSVLYRVGVDPDPAVHASSNLVGEMLAQRLQNVRINLEASIVEWALVKRFVCNKTVSELRGWLTCAPIECWLWTCSRHSAHRIHLPCPWWRRKRFQAPCLCWPQWHEHRQGLQPDRVSVPCFFCSRTRAESTVHYEYLHWCWVYFCASRFQSCTWRVWPVGDRQCRLSNLQRVAQWRYQSRGPQLQVCTAIQRVTLRTAIEKYLIMSAFVSTVIRYK